MFTYNQNVVLTKTRNNLKRPEMTWNDLQRARNDLERPTMTYNVQETTWSKTSKTQPSMTWSYLQRTKRCETTNNKQLFRLFYNMGQKVLFSNTFSTQHLVAVIRALLYGESWWKQSVKHLLSCVKRQLSCVFLRDIRFIFFCLGFMSAGKGRGYYFSSSLPLPSASQIVRSSAFAFIRDV